MKVDVACVGDPFLDLIFHGLPGMPLPGREQLARRLVVVPGGIANVAFALGRLELDAVVCAPMGRDPAGRFLAELMADAGVVWMGRPGEATPVTVALPVNGDRALVSLMPEPTVDLATLAGIEARAVVIDLPLVDRLPSRPNVFAVVGDPEVDVLAGHLPTSLHGVHALLLNEREACRLTGDDGALAAATRLAALGTVVVVTCGAAGAIAVEPGGAHHAVPARRADIADATGAGDLFTAAYVWADLAGHPLDERLRLATGYASLSLERPTDRQKGITRETFLALVGPS